MYRFKSRAAADLLMMPTVGDQILRIVGKEPSERGIIEAAALPEAIAALEVAIAAAEMAKRAGARDGEDDDSAGAAAIGLGQRAWPMLEMMRRSHAERADIVWGV